jgi:hypothetical protein
MGASKRDDEREGDRGEGLTFLSEDVAESTILPAIAGT